LVKRLGVNIVVYTGDLIDVGTDIRSYRDFFRIVSQVQAPQLAITGNHDWAQVDSTRLLVERFYGRYVVPLRVWSFTYGDFLFVGIDTRMEGYPEMWQLDYLEDVIARNTDKTVVILMHQGYLGSWRGTRMLLQS
jgi:DNA repair exonuclease SbcCD nuclease subunit